MSLLANSFISSATELFVVFVVSATFFFYLYFKYCYTYWSSRGVPTLNPIFPVGDLGKSALGQESTFLRLQTLYNEFKAKGCKHGGIYFFNGPVWFPIDTDLVKRVLISDFDYFMDRGMFMDEEKVPLTTHILSMSGTRWRHTRTKFSPAFTAGKMKSMYQIVQTNVQNLLSILRQHDGEDVDIKLKLTRLTTDIIGSTSFGIDCNSQMEPDTNFVRIVDRIFHHSSWKLLKLAIEEGFHNPGNVLKISHDDKEIEEFFHKLVKDTIDYRDKNNIVRDDLLNALMKMRPAMSLKEIVAQSYLFFTAGFETSSTVMSFTLHELAYNQKLQEQLRKDIHQNLGRDSANFNYDDLMNLPLLDRVVKETLRKYPPTTNLNRIVGKPYQIPDTDIVLEKGTPVVISLLGLHRDPELFPEPLKYDPDRFNRENEIVPYSYLPFGDGPRNCIGLRFGVMQTKIGLASMLNEFKFYPSDITPKEVPIDPKTTVIVLAVKGSIHIKLERI